MSEASRARRQHIINRLAELDAKLGPREPPREPEPYTGLPSWGPVGSLARATMDPLTFAALAARDAETVAQEHTRAALDDGRSEMPTAAEPVQQPTPDKPSEVWQHAT